MSTSDQYGKKAATSASDAASTASKMIEGVVDSAVDTAKDAASSAYKQAQVAGREVNKVAGNMKTAVDSSLAAQPMATLGMALVAGFILGAIWKS